MFIFYSKVASHLDLYSYTHRPTLSSKDQYSSHGWRILKERTPSRKILIQHSKRYFNKQRFIIFQHAAVKLADLNESVGTIWRLLKLQQQK